MTPGQHADSLALLSLDFPPNDGGISRLVGGMTQALHEAGCNTTVVTFEAAGREGLPRPPARYIEVPRRKGLRDWALFRAVRALKPGTPILTSVWNPEAALALLAGKRRISILAHGNEVMRYKGQSLKARLRRFVLERAHVVICNSHFTEGLVRDIAPGARTHVLNPAVDAAAFEPPVSKVQAREALDLPPGKRLVLTVARLDPIKGHDTVLRALSQLPEAERSAIHNLIVGSGGERPRLKALALELGVSDQVQFAGFVADAELPLWYTAADVFCLCSVVDKTRRGMEGFGMSLTEAQAAGLPVIGSRSGGITDAVKEGAGGWLIEEQDSAALAQHLSHLVAAPEAFAAQGKLGAARIRREMNWASYAARIRSIV